MDSSAIIISAVQIIASLAAVILFVGGIITALRVINYSNPNDADEEFAKFNGAMNKSTLLIGVGLALYFIARFCVNLVPLAEQNYGILAIAAQALLDTVKNSGYLILLPVFLRLWRKNIQRKRTK